MNTHSKQKQTGTYVVFGGTYVVFSFRPFCARNSQNPNAFQLRTHKKQTGTYIVFGGTYVVFGFRPFGDRKEAIL